MKVFYMREVILFERLVGFRAQFRYEVVRKLYKILIKLNLLSFRLNIDRKFAVRQPRSR